MGNPITKHNYDSKKASCPKALSKNDKEERPKKQKKLKHPIEYEFGKATYSEPENVMFHLAT